MGEIEQRRDPSAAPTSPRPSAPPPDVAAAVRDPARLAVLRAMCLEGTPTGPVFDRMTRLAARLLAAPVALGTIVDYDRQVVASAYDREDRYEPGASMPLSYSFCQYAVANRGPLVVEDALAHPLVRDNAATTENGVRAYAGIPLVVAGQPLGTLCVLDFRPREWTAEQLDILRDLAAGAAAELELHNALAEARGRAAAEQAVRRLEAVQHVTDVALRDRPVSELLHELLERIRAVLGTDAATLLLLDDERRELIVRASVGISESGDGDVRVPLGEGIAGRIAASGEPVIVNDLQKADVRRPVLKVELTSLLGVPLFVDGRVFGVLHVGTRDRREFDADDVRLLQLVAERAAAAIERTQLHERERAARLAAEAGDRAKAEFLAVMSHELRTPLNIIGGYAQLLLEGVSGSVAESQRGWLERIVGSQRHLLAMIERILAFADIDAGRASYEIEPFDVARLLGALAPEFEQSCRARGLAFALETPEQPLRAIADQKRVAQILRDLVSNAVKFTPGGGRVTLSCTSGGGRIRIDVADTGSGIPAGRMKDIFRHFVQVDQTSTRRHEGIGLGLAIARALARAMGGDLVVASREGEGTTATLELPDAAA